MFEVTNALLYTGSSHSLSISSSRESKCMSENLCGVSKFNSQPFYSRFQFHYWEIFLLPCTDSDRTEVPTISAWTLVLVEVLGVVTW